MICIEIIHHVNPYSAGIDFVCRPEVDPRAVRVNIISNGRRPIT